MSLPNGGAKRRHEPAGRAASSAGEMPTVFNNLLAPRESARRQLFPVFTIATGVDDHSAKKELKSGSLAPPLPSRAARRQRRNSPACAAFRAGPVE
jgi:hypothetical protein